MNRYMSFLKVVEVGSFTKAAEILGYTQPAMSQMIASLPMVYRRISIISRAEDELSVAAKTFIRFLIQNADALP